MPEAVSKKANLIEYFYDYLNEDDWVDGVDLYKSGKVQDVVDYKNLLIGRVLAISGSKFEVRLKIHPSGRVIQWIECTCKKNRTKGLYCEHIAAFVLHADRENPKFFNGLDGKAPLKPPSGIKKIIKGNQITQERKKYSEPETNIAASEKLLQHLKGSILSVSLAGKGPSIRVRVEMKPGSTTYYDLDIDASARFLKNRENSESFNTSVSRLEIFDSNAYWGTKIDVLESEKLIAEKIVSIPLNSRPSKSFLDKIQLKSQVDQYICLNDEGIQKFKYLLSVPLKTANRYIGEEFFFLPGVGYWPIKTNKKLNRWNDLPLSKIFRDDKAAEFVQSNFSPYIENSLVWVSKDLDLPDIIATPSLESVKVSSTHDDGWFHLDPKYGQGKSSISMAELMQQFSNKNRRFLKKGKSWIKIPDFITSNDWKLDSTGKYLKVDTLGLIRLKASVGEFDTFVGSKKALNELRQKTEFTKETTPPDLANTGLKLRNYQEIGLNWLWWLYKNNLHGLLADDMGLGKTHQAMALLTAIKRDLDKEKTYLRKALFLVVCPTTVLDHWFSRIEQFAPNLNAVLFHGPRRMSKLKEFSESGNTLLTSYGVLLRDAKKLESFEWETIVLDEAHFVKNNNTATYKAACNLKCQMRVCLTGTPMENHLGELKNIFDFLVPGYLGSDEYFKKHFLNPIEQQKDPEVEVALQRLIHPLKLRRTKIQVLKDLPEKLEEIRSCELSDDQIKLYREIVELKARPLIDQLTDQDKPVPFIHVFATLQLLKQICNHPSLLKPNSSYKDFESGKFELFKELLTESLNSGNKIVIFSQYLEMIKLIKAYCDDNELKTVVMTGQSKNRGKIIEQFQTDPETKIFIGSLLAGGIGIDLTAASVVIHYDRWWNASKENQATDRVHRIGQKNFVQVFKLVTKGTLEEKIDLMISSKQSVFNRFLEKDEEIFKSLSREDLIELLQY